MRTGKKILPFIVLFTPESVRVFVTAMYVKLYGIDGFKKESLIL